ncbi:basic helix-loop-helix ARNT-like protein cyc [Temnothorax americanus]|uniref:basic helix-loop-helix ARNT-like protein cyc n=1 Tax=Temnothorax americanus TaxID=1964332 RepID=UPI004067D5E2
MHTRARTAYAPGFVVTLVTRTYMRAHARAAWHERVVMYAFTRSELRPRLFQTNACARGKRGLVGRRLVGPNGSRRVSTVAVHLDTVTMRPHEWMRDTSRSRFEGIGTFQPNEWTHGRTRYESKDEGSLLPDTSSDVVENNDSVAAASDGACVNVHYHQHQHQQQHQQQQQQQQQQQRHHHHQLQQQQQHHPSAGSELDDFLRYRGTGITTGQRQEEMVAQEMAQGYTQLLHSAAAVPAQETPEYISLEELQPRIHHQEHYRTVHDTCTQLATSASQLYHQHHQHQQQQHQRNGGQQQQQQQHQRDYYNLSSVQSSCSTVYFGEIGTGSGVGELTTASAGGGGEGLAPTPTPASSSSGSTASTTTTPSSPSTTTTTTTTTTTSTSSTATIPQVATGAEPPQHMETPPTMVPDQQAPASGHHYHHHHHHDHHHRHHRSTSTTPSHGPATNTSDEFAPVSRKRKLSYHVGSDLLDDLGDDAKSVRTNDDSKKQNHSEIEKRRRDKMNTYITELSAMVPMCHAMSRKLDKLTVLRMAVQHLKTILGAVTSYTEGHYKPAFLSDQELKTLILQAAEGFVFVVGCDRGRILYVSESISQTLNYSQGDLLGQSWFDILHPKDVAKVKEQLSSSDLSPRERLIDAKTMLPVKTDVPQGVSRLCPGARRSFFCRMKRKVDGIRCGEMQVKEEADTAAGCHRRKKQQNVDWKYCVIQCTGYLKSWAPAKIGLEEQEGDVDETCNLSCLVAVGRVQTAISTATLSSRKPHSRPIQFVSRHAMDGKFLFVDQRATPVLGFLPQELLGTSMYEYYHHDDIPHLAESHKAALQTSERVTTQIYRFRSKGGNFVWLQSEWKSFRNPWTKDIEYLIAKNSAIL